MAVWKHTRSVRNSGFSSRHIHFEPSLDALSLRSDVISSIKIHLSKFRLWSILGQYCVSCGSSIRQEHIRDGLIDAPEYPVVSDWITVQQVTTWSSQVSEGIKEEEFGFSGGRRSPFDVREHRHHRRNVRPHIYYHLHTDHSNHLMLGSL